MSAADAELELAVALLGRGRVTEATQRLEHLARREVPRALTMLGSLLLHGEGVPPNVSRAIPLLLRAAELGDGLAAHTLASVHLCGLPGVPINPAEAQRFYDLALRLGMDPAAIPPHYRRSDGWR